MKKAVYLGVALDEQIHENNALRRCSVKKDVFKNFPKFTGKHLCQSLFFDKFAVLFFNCFLRAPFL